MEQGQEARHQSGGGRLSRHGVVGLSLAALVAGMLGLSYAAVPLYDLFCRVTGFAGTTQRAEKPSETVLDRRITVRFDANLARGMVWRFAPAERQVNVRIGENALAFYRASNPTSRPVRGTATFNVTPEIAGSYFNKIDCFCFTEQLLEPNQTVDMPVSFFVDPEIVNDPDARNISEITLSYTFFPVEGQPAQSAAEKDREKRQGS